MRHVFISDLHLSESAPALSDKFDIFINNHLGSEDKLYILGDFFNFWIGGDCITEFQKAIFDKLRQLKARRITVFLMVGNRDFLLEPDILLHYEIQPLLDPNTIQINGQNYLLGHGDAWCTDNHSYQKFRKIIRNKLVTTIFRKLPKSLRLSIANKLRQQSTKQQYDSLEDIVIDATDYQPSNANYIIHGHTHNPIMQHHFDSNGNTLFSRVALSDWGSLGNAYIVDDTNTGKFIYF